MGCRRGSEGDVWSVTRGLGGVSERLSAPPPPRSQEEEGIEKRRKEALSVRVFSIPGLTFCFLGWFVFLQFYILLSRHFSSHFTDENAEVQRD